MAGHNPKSAKIKENQRQLFTNQRKSIPTELTPPGWAQSQINANQRKSMKSMQIKENQCQLFPNQRISIPTELTPHGWAQSQISENQIKSTPIIPKST